MQIDRVGENEWNETKLMGVRYVPLTSLDEQLRGCHHHQWGQPPPPPPTIQHTSIIHDADKSSSSLTDFWATVTRLEGDPGRGGLQGTRPCALGQLGGPASRGQLLDLSTTTNNNDKPRSQLSGKIDCRQ
eukprot:1196129-Prorocentrum_minimum.AAC.4